MRSYRTYFLNLLLLPCALGQSSSPVGFLRGSVADEQGRPLPGAEVRYSRVFRSIIQSGRPVPGPGEAVLVGKVLTDANGAFSAPNLPIGNYTVCGTVPSAPYLDPCRWQGASQVSVNSNAVTDYALVLKKGVFLKVRINDPVELLPRAKDGPLRAGNLIVGVTYANGAYLGAENTNVDATGRDYQMIIPAGVPFKLWLFSRHVALVDAIGATVDMSGALIPFQAVAGKDQTFTFTVVGPLAQAQ